MAVLLDDAASEYLQVDSATLTAEPISIHAVFYADAVTRDQALFWLGDKDVTNHWWVFGVNSGDAIFAETTGVGGSANATSSTMISVNTWHSGTAVFAAINDRRAFLDGAGKGIQGSTRTSQNADRTAIGAYRDSSPRDFWSGRIACVCMWNITLSDAEVLNAHNSLAPWTVRRDALKGLWIPYTAAGPTPDLSGNGVNLSHFNTPAVADHAPLAPPFGFDLGWQGAFGAAAPPSGRTMGSLAGLGGLAGHGGLAGKGGGIAA